MTSASTPKLQRVRVRLIGQIISNIKNKQNSKRALSTKKAVLSSDGMDGNPITAKDKPDRTPIRLTAADIPTAEFARLLTSPTISILVGPTRKSFAAHKALLCHLVPYFASAFSGAFAEAGSSEIYLADDDPAAIEQFISWLYRGSEGLTVNGDYLVPLVDLYVLADMWCAPMLQNNLTDVLIDYFHGHKVGGLKAMTKVVKACYFEVRLLKHLKHMLLFETVELAFKVGTADEDLQALLGCDVDFAKDLASWQIEHFKQKKNMLGKLTKKDLYV